MSIVLTGKPQLNRVVNRRLILNQIRLAGTISRAALAKQTAIRPPTVSSVIRDLIDDRLVTEVGAGETSGGRAPRMLALNLERPLVLGFELSETTVHAGLCDLTGTLMGKCKVKAQPQSPEKAVKRLADLGGRLLEKAGLEWDQLVGVGVAVPGHLDLQRQAVRWSQPFGWRDVPLKSLCEAAWSTPTDIVNDSLAGAMAEHLFEAEQTIKNLLFLYLRLDDVGLDVVGLGTGIIINGEPYRGEFGAAGEFSTEFAHPLVHARREGKEYESVDAFLAAYRNGDSVALEAMRRLGEELARVVRDLVNLLEPGVVVVGTDAVEVRDDLLTQLEEDIRAHQTKHALGQTRLVGSTLGDYGVTRGSTVPALQRLFRVPQLSM